MPKPQMLAALSLGAVAIALAAFGCSDDDPPPCFNGSCACPPDQSCQLPCFAPPCHISCVRNNPSCIGQCGNGDCFCGPSSNCQFTCQSPPCHVNCDRGTQCTGTCANGECSCAAGSSCSFTCSAGPCHVECEGDNGACNGECANGSCSCGPNSSCHFSCIDDNCHASCAAGSACVLECSGARAGEQGCRFDSCAAGTPVVCPGGKATACGAPCPG